MIRPASAIAVLGGHIARGPRAVNGGKQRRCTGPRDQPDIVAGLVDRRLSAVLSLHAMVAAASASTVMTPVSTCCLVIGTGLSNPSGFLFGAAGNAALPPLRS